MFFYCVGDGYESCKNINECKKNTHKCHPDAICTDNIGNYTCKCRDGYKGQYLCEDIVKHL